MLRNIPLQRCCKQLRVPLQFLLVQTPDQECPTKTPTPFPSKYVEYTSFVFCILYSTMTCHSCTDVPWQMLSKWESHEGSQYWWNTIQFSSIQFNLIQFNQFVGQRDTFLQHDTLLQCDTFLQRDPFLQCDTFLQRGTFLQRDTFLDINV